VSGGELDEWMVLTVSFMGITGVVDDSTMNDSIRAEVKKLLFGSQRSVPWLKTITPWQHSTSIQGSRYIAAGEGSTE